MDIHVDDLLFVLFRLFYSFIRNSFASVIFQHCLEYKFISILIIIILQCIQMQFFLVINRAILKTGYILSLNAAYSFDARNGKHFMVFALKNQTTFYLNKFL